MTGHLSPGTDPDRRWVEDRYGQTLTVNVHDGAVLLLIMGPQGGDRGLLRFDNLVEVERLEGLLGKALERAKESDEFREIEAKRKALDAREPA